MDRVMFLCNNKQAIHNAYTPEQIGDHPILTAAELDSQGGCEQTEVVFSTWGMPPLTEEEIGRLLPNLKEIYYGAGSVQQFARPFLKKGVRIFSAWAANAVPVAEYTLAQILLANKGYFQLDARYRREGFKGARDYSNHFEGNYHNRVGLLGAGMVGRKVIENLKPFDLEVVVFDPFLPDEAARTMNVRKASLEEVFESCPVVSNHLANNADTVGMLNYGLFSRMSPWGVFINTGRNAQVVVADLIRAMREEPGRTALLDVTDPEEPLPLDHELFTVPNIQITPHRAGSCRGEVYRMGDYMMEEYKRVHAGEAPRWEVTLEMLKTMA